MKTFPSRWRRALLTGAVIAVLLTAGAIVLSHARQPNHAAAAKARASMSPSVGATSHAVLTAQQAQQLTSDTTSGNPGRVAHAVAFPAGKGPSAQLVSSLARLRSLIVDAASFQDLGGGVGQAGATVIDTAGHQQHWTLYFASINGSWKVTATVPKHDPNPPTSGPPTGSGG